MPEEASGQVRERKAGRVARIGQEYGFIECDELPGESLYFRTSWFRGSSIPQRGDEVTFEVQVCDDGKRQARRVAEAGAEYLESNILTAERRAPKANEFLLEWAYLGHIPRVVNQLSDMALQERWEFLNASPNPDKPHPILYSYLLQTFGRLSLEEKVLVSEDRSFAAFNTGLVDRRYEQIYAMFGPNDSREQIGWKLLGFCLPGEGQLGQSIVRSFNPLPDRAHYFDKPADVFYDTTQGEPEMDWDHVVIDRVQRYPAEFLEDHWPSGIELLDTPVMPEENAAAYWLSVGEAIKQDTRTYRHIMNRVRDAVTLSIKRAAWNFKTAVPQYYPPIKKLQLLLPVCLVEDERADMALAVEKTPSDRYLGHTMLPLDWAYKNARLICRPDSDWLDAHQIVEGADEELE